MRAGDHCPIALQADLHQGIALGDVPAHVVGVLVYPEFWLEIRRCEVSVDLVAIGIDKAQVALLTRLDIPRIPGGAWVGSPVEWVFGQEVIVPREILLIGIS